SKLAILGASLLSACVAAPLGPPAPYNGKPVAFPIQFLGAAKVGNFIMREEFADVPLECDYDFDGKKGKFRTPATIIFEFTNKLKTLKVDCTVNTVVKRGIRRPKVVGKVSGSIQTSTTNTGENRYIGDYLSYYELNYNGNLELLRGQVMHDRGVQIFHPVIAIIASDR
ncbi:MAG: hypothetical protein ORN49_05345, partial [Rhodobacteraceae bacterium]|nr:hypothetical protein [Paracoccaceae bacterium]